MAMNDEERIDPSHGCIRGLLRVIGPVIAIIGLGFTVVGMVSFFEGFGAVARTIEYGSHESIFPDKFWCAFVGLPLLGIGIGISKFAYMGAVTRYVAGEIAPPAADTLNYLADETEEGVASVARAISRGLGHNDQEDADVSCHKCGEGNDTDARFCKSCGSELARACPSCGAANDADAKFCDKCGQAL